MNLHDVQELESSLMKDVEENLLHQQRMAWGSGGRDSDENNIMDLSLLGASYSQGAAAASSTPDLTDLDAEERALLDLLDLEERSGADNSLLNPDFLMYPSRRREYVVGSQGNRNVEPMLPELEGPMSSNQILAALKEEGSDEIVRVLREEEERERGKRRAKEQVGMTLESLKKAVAGKWLQISSNSLLRHLTNSLDC